MEEDVESDPLPIEPEKDSVKDSDDLGTSSTRIRMPIPAATFRMFLLSFTLRSESLLIHFLV